MLGGTMEAMIPFLIIYFSGVFAFADAFESIEQLLVIERRVEPVYYMPFHTDGETFYEKFFKTYAKAFQTSFLASLGELNPNLDKYREIDWLVFFISVFFNIIMLMNLLIAIISEAYEIISYQRDVTSYKTKVGMMSMMQNTVFGYIKEYKNQNPSPIEMVFTAKVHNHKGIAKEILNEEDEDGESQLLLKMKDLVED